MSATIIAFKPKSTDEDVPPRRWSLSGEQWYALLGMTPRQAEMAFWISFRSKERSKLTRAALCRYIEVLRAFEPALEDYREELRKNMDMYCPRAAKRIREGKPPRRRKASPAGR